MSSFAHNLPRREEERLEEGGLPASNFISSDGSCSGDTPNLTSELVTLNKGVTPAFTSVSPRDVSQLDQAVITNAIAKRKYEEIDNQAYPQKKRILGSNMILQDHENSEGEGGVVLADQHEGLLGDDIGLDSTISSYPDIDMGDMTQSAVESVKNKMISSKRRMEFLNMLPDQDTQTGRSFSSGSNLQTNITGNVIQAKGNVIIQTGAHEKRVDLHSLRAKLNPVDTATYNSSVSKIQSCLEGTRTQILEKIKVWVQCDRKEASVYILNGVAGIGKSTVAQTIANWAAQNGFLGASHFFSRSEGLRTTTRGFFPSIAFQLAKYAPELASQIALAIDAQPDIAQKMLRDQLSTLILNPLQGTLSQFKHSVLIVIDALDECNEEEAKGLLQLLLLASSSSSYSPQLKFFVTTRPEFHIRQVLHQNSHCNVFHLHEIEESIVQSDIKLYLEHHLSSKQIASALPGLEPEWKPSSNDIQALCDMSGKLFIIASTAVKFILDPLWFDPAEQLQNILQSVSCRDSGNAHPTDTLDMVYMQILLSASLKSCCRGPTCSLKQSSGWVACYQRILGAVLVLQEPLSCKALADLLGSKPSEIERTLSCLHSLIAPVGSDKLYHVHHKSFPDFIISQERVIAAYESIKIYDNVDVQAFILNPTSDHSKLGESCFLKMRKNLHWNMCSLSTNQWYKDHDKDEYIHLTKEAIVEGLTYACIHWGAHLKHGKYNGTIDQLVQQWAREQLFCWGAALGLTGKWEAGMNSLKKAISSMNTPNYKMTLRLLESANQFLLRNRNLVEISPMHIFWSAAGFAPTADKIYKIYGSKNFGFKMIAGGGDTWNPLIFILQGHSGPIASVAFSADGSRLASGSEDNTVRLWDGHTGAHISTLKGHSESIWSVAFSADGSRLASGSSDNTVRLWDGHTGAHISTLEGHSDAIWSVAFSADGSKLASGSSDNTVRLWDGHTGAHISTLEGHSLLISSVAFSADGSRLASGSEDNTVRLWDGQTGAHISTLEGHSESISSVAFSADGSRLASGSSDKTVRLWDGHTGAHISTLEGHSESIWSVAFSADGSRLASGSRDKTVRLWDGQTGAHISTLEGHSESIWSVAFSADGSRLASGSSDNTVRLWDGHTGAHISTLEGHSESIWSVAFSADGSRLASESSDKTVRLWDGHTGAHISTLEGHSDAIWSVAFSADGSRLVSGSGYNTLRLWDGHTGAHISTLEGHSLSIWSIAFSADGSRLTSRSRDKTVRLWDGHTGAHISTLEGHSDAIWSVAFSADGSRLVSGSGYNTLRLWDGHTGAHISTLESHSACSADGSRLASGSSDNTVRLWDGHTGAHISTLKGHSESIWPVAFSADGSRLASGSSDNTVRLWDGHTGAHISTLEGHTDFIRSVTFSADGSRLASESSDKTVRLWDGHTGAHISTLEGHTDFIRSVTFSADGSRLASESSDKTVRLWDGHTGAHISTLEGHSGSISSLAFSADGSRLASGSSDNTVRLWDGHTGAHISTLEAHLPDVLLFATHTNPSISHHSPLPTATQLSFTSKEYLFLAVKRSCHPELYGIAAVPVHCDSPSVHPFLWLPQHTGKITCFTLNSTGTTLAVAFESGHLFLFDISCLCLP